MTRRIGLFALALALLVAPAVSAVAAIAQFSYLAAHVSQNAYPTLRPGDSYQFEVKLRNIGISTWRQGSLNLGTDRPADRVPVFLREDRVTNQASGWISPNRVRLVETSIAPNQVGTFRFWYTVPTNLADGVYREYFRPVADGMGWLPDLGIYWDVTVARTIPVTYHASYVSQNSHPTLQAGQGYLFEVQFRNTGTATWQQGSVNLGTDRPADRTPVFVRQSVPAGQATGWLSPNRALLVESSVAPGAIGTFRFWYTVPTNLATGVYREYFRPVADGVSWLEDFGVYWDVTVQPVSTGGTGGASASASASAGAGASAGASASSGIGSSAASSAAASGSGASASSAAAASSR